MASQAYVKHPAPETLHTELNNLAVLKDTPIDCPYLVGEMIRFFHEETAHEATIKAVYTGGEELLFSNSCTMLIEFEEPGTSFPHVNERELVLKLMDWRFAQAPRNRYDCGVWNWGRLINCLDLEQSEVQKFKLWLTKEIPQTTLDHGLVQPLLQTGLLSSRSINADLFAYVIDKPNGLVKPYQKAGFLPFKVDSGHREVFLQYYHAMQVATECFISSKLARSIPGKMPCVLGAVSLQSKSASVLSNDILHRFPVCGILMEKVNGQPLPLVGKSVVDEISLRPVLRDLTIFQMQLWRNRLQITDLNLYNFILQRDNADRLSFRMVDYGAISIVHTDVSTHSTLYLPLLGIKYYLPTEREDTLPIILEDTLPLLLENYSTCFSDENEEEILYGIVNCLLPDVEGSETIVEEYRTHCFKADFDDPFDRFTWQTIMLHLLHSYNRKSFTNHSEILYDTLRRANRIMNEELYIDDPEPWWCRALYRLTVITGDNYNEAKSTLLKLLELMYDSDDINTEALVPFLTELLEVAFEINETRLMFLGLPLIYEQETTNQSHFATEERALAVQAPEERALAEQALAERAPEDAG